MLRVICGAVLLAAIVTGPQCHARSLHLDPIKRIDRSVAQNIDKLQGLVDYARNAASAIIREADDRAKARLEQVDDIIDDAFEEVDRLVDKTAEKINAILDKYINRIDLLTKEIMAELARLIDKAECSASKVFEISVAQVLAQLHLNGTTIVAPEMEPGECGRTYLGLGPCVKITKTFTIRPMQYDRTFKEIEEYLIVERLEKMSNEKTPISSFVDTYGTVGNLAKATACFDTVNRDRHYADYVKYFNKARTWKRLFGPDVGSVP
jgi:hypothetical protein